MPTLLAPLRSLGFAAVLLATAPAAQLGPPRRVPAAEWLRYAKVEDAGFDAGQIEAARRRWEELPSSAFLVIADGAVVAAWGATERRFMCHSVRKSFLSALYGIYWDRGELELNKTLADLELDDTPGPLLDSEKQARILDLLKARSGVFHPAAYAGRTDSRPRGSEGPGRFFAYNNWDFNTLAAILRMETGADVFEGFDEHFARPLGMQDWRVSDGYYHLEPDKSQFPAYPFRLSARDAARFGLLFARDGRWGAEQLLSRAWVRRSSALYSIDDEVAGYGFMWWVLREPRFAEHGMFAALGVGNQMIAALPDSDLVIVNRANTYANERTPMGPLLDLIESILAARTQAPAADPELVPLEAAPLDPRLTSASAAELEPFVGAWPLPAPLLGGSPYGSLLITPAGGHLVATAPQRGTFKLYLQADETLLEEDSHEPRFPLRAEDGTVVGLGDRESVTRAIYRKYADSAAAPAKELTALVESSTHPTFAAARIVRAILEGREDDSEAALFALAERAGAATAEREINTAGYSLLDLERPHLALAVLELNTRVFADAYNAWDSLGDAHQRCGNRDLAIECYERTLELRPRMRSAVNALRALRPADAR